VKGGKADEANAWQLKDDRSGFDALSLETVRTTEEGDSK
jgi:hypothetical protein